MIRKKKKIILDAEKNQCPLIHPCECVRTVFFIVCLDLIADSRVFQFSCAPTTPDIFPPLFISHMFALEICNVQVLLMHFANPCAMGTKINVFTCFEYIYFCKIFRNFKSNITDLMCTFEKQ